MLVRAQARLSEHTRPCMQAASWHVHRALQDLTKGQLLPLLPRRVPADKTNSECIALSSDVPLLSWQDCVPVAGTWGKMAPPLRRY